MVGKPSSYLLTTLDDAVSVATTLTRSWFRGHSTALGKLVPRLYRKSFLGVGVTEFRPDLEMAGIEEFKRRAPLLSAFRLPATDDHFGWLALMQHYGMPTRLLDWTENALVALYFAVHQDGSEDGEFWALLPWALNQLATGAWGVPLIGRSAHVRYVVEQPYWTGSDVDLARELGLEAPVEYPCAVEPPDLFPRMAVQSSTLTIHPRPPGGLGIQNALPDEKHLVRYVIPSRAKRVLQQGLHQLGFDHRRLFPDLEGLSRSLNPGWIEVGYSPPAPPRCSGEC